MVLTEESRTASIRLISDQEENIIMYELNKNSFSNKNMIYDNFQILKWLF